jgi:sigma-B regulation protein RsbU (phosphoserine phosphatase)
MEDNTLEQFRKNLTHHRDALVEWYNSDSSEKNIHLGGAAVDEVLQVISKLDEALRRIDRGKFGKCEECSDDGEVETERLEIDFTTCVCIDHYSETQIRALERDLELAAKVQRQLLPRYVPALAGIEISAHTEPARIVSGDYYDFFLCQDGLQGVAVADVMGKGLGASMLMSNLQASLRILGPEYGQPHQLLSRLNELFRYNLKLIRFISIFLARIDVEKNVFQYSNAGHHPPLWWDVSSKSIRWLSPTGPAIGLFHQPEYRSEMLQFSSGDLFLLYTDGLVEARNVSGEEFGEQRLAEFVKENHQQSADDFSLKLREALKRFSGKLQDDMTMLVIKIR